MAAAPGAASAGVWQTTLRERGPRKGCPPRDVVDVAYPPSSVSLTWLVHDLSDTLEIALRVTAFAGALVTIGMALFLYEDEEGKLQNRLEEWWVKIDDVERLAVARHVAFMRTVTNLVSSGLDRFFGQKLFSLRVVSMSSAYSIATLCGLAVIAAFMPRLFNLEKMPDTFPVGTTAAISLGFFGAGTLVIFKPWTAKVILALVAVLLALGFIFTPIETRGGSGFAGWVAVSGGVLGGIVTDVISVAIIRRMLRWGADLTSSSKLAGVVLLTCAIPTLFVIVPLLAGGIIFWLLRERAALIFVGYPMLGMALANILTALPALLFLLLVFALIAHRLFWPLLKRPIYAASRYGLVQNKKLLWSVGLGLLTLSGGGWVRDAVKGFAP